MDKYARPYCENCNLIWGRYSIGLVLNCTECEQPLILKSFNPWPKMIGGVAIILLGLLTLLVSYIPIIWIGGFIVGGSMIHNGAKQCDEISKLDEKSKIF